MEHRFAKIPIFLWAHWQTHWSHNTLADVLVNDIITLITLARDFPQLVKFVIAFIAVVRVVATDATCPSGTC